MTDTGCTRSPSPYRQPAACAPICPLCAQRREDDRQALGAATDAAARAAARAAIQAASAQGQRRWTAASLVVAALVLPVVVSFAVSVGEVRRVAVVRAKARATAANARARWLRLRLRRVAARLRQHTRASRSRALLSRRVDALARAAASRDRRLAHFERRLARAEAPRACRGGDVRVAHVKLSRRWVASRSRFGHDVWLVPTKRGLRLRRVRVDSPSYVMGLRRGDLVARVAGVSLARGRRRDGEAVASEVLSRAVTRRRVEIDVCRGRRFVRLILERV